MLSVDQINECKCKATFLVSAEKESMIFLHKVEQAKSKNGKSKLQE